jgi:hypothetical protein
MRELSVLLFGHHLNCSKVWRTNLKSKEVYYYLTSFKLLKNLANEFEIKRSHGERVQAGRKQK